MHWLKSGTRRSPGLSALSRGDTRMARCVALRQFNEGWFSKKEWFHFDVFSQMMSGFPANSVFIVDSKDRVRHQTVLDSRFRQLQLQ